MAPPLRVWVPGGWYHGARNLRGGRGTSGKPDEKEQTWARQLGFSRTGWTEVVKAAGGRSYGSGAQGVRRFEKGLGKDGKKQRFVRALRRRSD